MLMNSALEFTSGPGIGLFFFNVFDIEIKRQSNFHQKWKKILCLLENILSAISDLGMNK